MITKIGWSTQPCIAGDRTWTGEPACHAERSGYGIIWTAAKATPKLFSCHLSSLLCAEQQVSKLTSNANQTWVVSSANRPVLCTS